MKRRVFCRLSGLALGFAFLAAPGTAIRAEESVKIRVGVYDNRAVACAYAPSKYNPVSEKMRQYKEAKARGDEKKCAELKAWGEKHQRQLHRQGFAKVPVDDLLVHVRDGLAALAKEKKLALITRECDYQAPNVEIVDVTDEIVRLYDPSEKTLKIVEEIRKVEPAGLEVVEKHHDH